MLPPGWPGFVLLGYVLGLVFVFVFVFVFVVPFVFRRVGWVESVGIVLGDVPFDPPHVDPPAPYVPLGLVSVDVDPPGVPCVPAGELPYIPGDVLGLPYCGVPPISAPVVCVCPVGVCGGRCD